MDAGSDSGSQVARTCQDVSQMLVPHVLVARSFHVLFDQLQAGAPPLEDFIDVPPFLHGNHSKVVLFVDPNQEVLLVVVPTGKRSKSNGTQSRLLTPCLRRSTL